MLKEKLSKYKDLEIEIKRMWDMSTEIVPVVVGALGIIKKGLDKVTSSIPGNISTNEIQKIRLQWMQSRKTWREHNNNKRGRLM